MLDDEPIENLSQVMDSYKDVKLVLLNGMFVQPCQLVVDISEDCSPYLYGLNTASHLRSLHGILRLLRINEKCSKSTVLTVLVCISRFEFIPNANAISNEILGCVNRIVSIEEILTSSTHSLLMRVKTPFVSGMYKLNKVTLSSYKWIDRLFRENILNDELIENLSQVMDSYKDVKLVLLNGMQSLGFRLTGKNFIS
jgi:hypothetical protein